MPVSGSTTTPSDSEPTAITRPAGFALSAGEVAGSAGGGLTSSDPHPANATRPIAPRAQAACQRAS